jgi:hypothetical protein
LRLVSALGIEQSEEWLAGRVYLDMRKLEATGDDQVPLAAVVTEEVKNMAAWCPPACGREGGAKVHRLRALTPGPSSAGPA